MIKNKKSSKSRRPYNYVVILNGLLKSWKIKCVNFRQRKLLSRKLNKTEAKEWWFFLMYKEAQKKYLGLWNNTTSPPPWNHTLPFTLYRFIPRTKRDPLHTSDDIHEILCMNCTMSYVGETGGKFNTRLEEHKSEVEKVSRSVTATAGRKKNHWQPFKSL